jgi:hypothetical protein
MSLFSVWKIMTRWFEYPLKEDSGCRHRAVQTLARHFIFPHQPFYYHGPQVLKI